MKVARIIVEEKKVIVRVTGLNGKSAYEIAVVNGFEGTEQEWLQSLVQKNRYLYLDYTRQGGGIIINSQVNTSAGALTYSIVTADLISVNVHGNKTFKTIEKLYGGGVDAIVVTNDTGYDVSVPYEGPWSTPTYRLFVKIIE